MHDETLLFRQVHPKFVQNGRFTRMVFDTFDANDLSVDDGDMVTPDDAFERYTTIEGHASAGVAAVSNRECTGQGLSVNRAPSCTNKAHCLIDFSNKDKKDKKTASLRLHIMANRRGWMYGPKMN